MARRNIRRREKLQRMMMSECGETCSYGMCNLSSLDSTLWVISFRSSGCPVGPVCKTFESIKANCDDSLVVDRVVKRLCSCRAILAPHCQRLYNWTRTPQSLITSGCLVKKPKSQQVFSELTQDFCLTKTKCEGGENAGLGPRTLAPMSPGKRTFLGSRFGSLPAS